MAKLFRLTDEMLDEYVRHLKESLSARICYKQSVSLVNKDIDKKTTLVIEPLAMMKMMSLVAANEKEVAWHGLAYRTDNGFKVTDILVPFPQKVTGATVDTDDTEYINWLSELPDETFEALRFHGHSHVRMATNPSSTDEDHRAAVVAKLGEDDFFIFMILNKSNEFTLRIYDARENCVYEKSDVEITFFEGQKEFLKQAKEAVHEQSYATTCASTTASYPKASAVKPLEQKKEPKTKTAAATKSGKAGKSKKKSAAPTQTTYLTKSYDKDEDEDDDYDDGTPKKLPKTYDIQDWYSYSPYRPAKTDDWYYRGEFEDDAAAYVRSVNRNCPSYY